MASIVITTEAARQVQAIDLWWQDHSAAPALFYREYQDALTRLSLRPYLGAPYVRPRVQGIRHLLLPKTQHYLYYTYNLVLDEITVHAVWATHRRGKPRLP